MPFLETSKTGRSTRASAVEVVVGEVGAGEACSKEESRFQSVQDVCGRTGCDLPVDGFPASSTDGHIVGCPETIGASGYGCWGHDSLTSLS